MSETQSLSIAAIRIDGGTQPRVIIATEKVGDYAEDMRAGKSFPPIDVFFDGVDHWLADGFHRYHAVKRLDRPFITATIHTGTKREAVLFSVGANHGHGIQRTNADKRKAVMTLLSDLEWGAWADREIARRCGVGHQLVGELRPVPSSLDESSSEKPSRTYTTKHGTEATMRVEKIGRQRGVVARKKAAYAAKKAAAMEGASTGMLKRLPSKHAAEVVTNAMQALDSIVGVLATIDVEAVMTDPRAQQWRETTATTIAALRAFHRQLERKTA